MSWRYKDHRLDMNCSSPFAVYQMVLRMASVSPLQSQAVLLPILKRQQSPSKRPSAKRLPPQADDFWAFRYQLAGTCHGFIHKDTDNLSAIFRNQEETIGPHQPPRSPLLSSTCPRWR